MLALISVAITFYLNLIYNADLIVEIFLRLTVAISVAAGHSAFVKLKSLIVAHEK